MRRDRQQLVLLVSFVAIVILTIWMGLSRIPPMPASLPLDRWDVNQLAAHLSISGVDLDAVPTQRNGDVNSAAYLTAGKKDWNRLNSLSKHPARIRDWEGIVYCARESPMTAGDLERQWGEHCLLIGPFIFYGDDKLLVRIAAALHHTPPANNT